MAFLDLHQLSFAYPGQAPVVRGVDWTLARGDIHGLVGRSGCGKTTLLKLAAGLLSPSGGQVSLQGQPLRAPGPNIGFVFQSPTLLDWLSVLDNVMLPMRLQAATDAGQRAAALALLDLLGLAGHAHRHPRQLSGGQQSRVALARALVLQPPLLLLDEPFAALDALTREEVQDDLLRLCALRGSTVLLVTHDLSEAMYLADRVAVMDAGRIVEELAVTLPRPRHRALRYGADFNALCGRLRGALDEVAVA